jgi:RNA polymerase sigma-70 factor (ECF subfamily)
MPSRAVDDVAAATGSGAVDFVLQAQQGDRDAYAALVETRADRLLRTARAILRDQADASDATQETLLTAWVQLPRLRNPASFDAWLHRTLINECRARLRKRRRSREVDLEVTTARTGDHASNSVEVASVQAAFARISVEDRLILLLHHLHGLSLPEMASQLDIPVGTAKSRLWRARKALARALEAEA